MIEDRKPDSKSLPTSKSISDTRPANGEAELLDSEVSKGTMPFETKQSSDLAQDAMKKIRDGQKLRFPRGAPVEIRTVSSIWIEDAIRNGKDVDITGAVIMGFVNLSSLTIEGRVALIDCDLQDEVDFSYSFLKKQLHIVRCQFLNKATFDSITCSSDWFLTGTEFKVGTAFFTDMHVQGVFSASKLRFANKVGCHFIRSRFDKDVFFNESEFGGVVDFSSVEIRGDIYFDACVFKKNAIFDGLTVVASLYLDSVEKTNAQFMESASFIGITTRDLSATHAQFHKAVDFSGAEIRGSAYLNQVVCKGTANFTAMHITGNALFPSADFHGPSFFRLMYVGAKTKFQGARFARKAVFSGAKFLGEADFHNEKERNTSFLGDVRFRAVEFGADANFTRAQFVGVSQAIYFEQSKFSGDAIFVGAKFSGKAFFAHSRVLGQARFEGSQFDNLASFGGIRISGAALFSDRNPKGYAPVKFLGGARFRNVEVDSSVDFEGAHFKGRIDFSYSGFKANVSFKQAIFDSKDSVAFVNVRFQQECNFNSTDFRQGADFTASHFHVGASFCSTVFGAQTKFDSCQFLGLADFGRPPVKATEFQSCSFEHARFAGDARFENTVFKAHASFRETSFRVLYLSESGKVGGEAQFGATIDLGGCEYQRVSVSWKALLIQDNALPRLQPVERQAYVRLEQTLKEMGDDQTAERVYLERRKIDRKRMWTAKRYGPWFLDMMYSALANYGVRPYRLAAFCLTCLLLGVTILSMPGAVVPAPKSFQNVPQNQAQIQLSPHDALATSIHYFLPIEVPMGAGWVPSDTPEQVVVSVYVKAWHFWIRPSTFSTIFLRIAGWIFVPLAIAGISGILRRADR